MIENYRKVLAALTGLSLFNLFVVMLVASISRYFFNYSIMWSEELAKYSMIYGVMFGMIICYLDGTHIKFSVLNGFIKESLQKKIDFITDISVLGCGFIIAYSGYLFTQRRGSIVSPGTGIEMYYFQSAIIVGGVGLIIAAVLRLLSYRQKSVTHNTAVLQEQND
ncbi:TRAP transporter small permease [Photobacterium sanctipauli]|uniref:TRAP transporter small permease protein n=2 Tax=Photobacterium sanctipauli TaxID=1342794 RepID=A0A2T3P117_9GAMM|nr:TRAP transporter small permease [Photobacterium sanctipauli]PSW22221.1 TRAP transporter small permease [Photobacterium sanctipauli]